MQDICLLICSNGYLEIGPEVTAAAAIFGVLVSEIEDERSILAANSMKEKYGLEKLQKALSFMYLERSRTLNAAHVKKRASDLC